MSQTSDETRFLAHFPAYRQLVSGENRRRLAIEERRKGEYLCRAGEELPRLLFLVEGRARVFLPLYAGRSFLFRIYQPGDIVGDLEFFLDTPAATCSVQCTCDALIVSFPMQWIRTDAARLSLVVLALGREVAVKLRQSSLSEAVNTGYPVESRLAAYFLTHRDPQFQARNLQELSDWLGTSYRHLTRTLKRLVASGALAKRSGHYEIVDEGRLDRLAGDVLSDGALRM